MSISNGVVQALVRNDSSQLTVPGRDYRLIALDGRQAIKQLYPLWDDASGTFEARARDLAGSNPKAQVFAATLVLDVPLLVQAAPRRIVLPNTKPQSPEDLVVVEGNHRMLAVALRALWRMPLPRCVGVFVAIG
jgi:hypothetical protein